MTDPGIGGAEAGGASIASAVGFASAFGSVGYDRSPTSSKRVVLVPADNRVAVVIRLRDNP